MDDPTVWLLQRLAIYLFFEFFERRDCLGSFLGLHSEELFWVIFVCDTMMGCDYQFLGSVSNVCVCVYLMTGSWYINSQKLFFHFYCTIFQYFIPYTYNKTGKGKIIITVVVVASPLLPVPPAASAPDPSSPV